MARPRKPTALLELTGAFKKDPQRRAGRENEPTPTAEIGAPVASLSEIEGECWRRLMEIAPPGVVKNSDEAVMEMAAKLWAKVKTGRAVINEQSLFLQILKQLGMTPSARSMVSVEKQKSVNPFDV